MVSAQHTEISGRFFGHTTANIAAWNLEGYGGIPDSTLDRQVEGLAMLDAEVVALVEINPISAKK